MDYLNEIMSEQAKKLIAQKDELILKRIEERANVPLPFDLAKELKRTFPRICCVRDSFDNSEYWYWNDGSEGGLLLITFYPMDPIFNQNLTSEPTFKFTMEIKYK